MCDVTEIIEQLERFGVPKGEAHIIVGRLIVIGAASAPYRPETADAVADLAVERQRRKDRRARTA